MTKKYELTDEYIESTDDEWKLYRIRALKDFGCVKKGDLGGFIENESCLSHEGTCWVYDDAKVYDKSVVSDYASVRNKAEVSGHCRIKGHATVKDNAKVYGCCDISGHTVIYDNALVCQDVNCDYYTRIGDNLRLAGIKRISGVCVKEINPLTGYVNSCVLLNNKLYGSIDKDSGDSRSYEMPSESILFRLSRAVMFTLSVTALILFLKMVVGCYD